MSYTHSSHAEAHSSSSHSNAYTKAHTGPSHTHSYYHAHTYRWAFSYTNVVSTFPYSHPDTYCHSYPKPYRHSAAHPDTYALVQVQCTHTQCRH